MYCYTTTWWTSGRRITRHGGECSDYYRLGHIVQSRGCYKYFDGTYCLHLQGTLRTAQSSSTRSKPISFVSSQVQIWQQIWDILTFAVSFLSPAPNYMKINHGCFLSNPFLLPNFASNSPYSIWATRRVVNETKEIKKTVVNSQRLRGSMFLPKPITTNQITRRHNPQHSDISDGQLFVTRRRTNSPFLILKVMLIPYGFPTLRFFPWSVH